MYCRVSNEIDLFKKDVLYFWFIAFTIHKPIQSKRVRDEIIKGTYVMNFMDYCIAYYYECIQVQFRIHGY